MSQKKADGLQLTTWSLEGACSKYRVSYREKETKRPYNGRRHFAIVNASGFSGAGIASYIFFRSAMFSYNTFLFVFLVTFFGVNLLEYSYHRWSLHGNVTNHSAMHHRFFTNVHMLYDTFDDVKAILFEERAPLLLFIVEILASTVFYLIAATVAMLRGNYNHDVVLCLVSYIHFTMSVYYVTYEWLHLAYHTPRQSILGRLPFISILRRHHQIHHTPVLMRRYNFNVTFPFWDIILGTSYNGKPLPPALSEASQLQERFQL
jgi:hypothetical protein